MKTMIKLIYIFMLTVVLASCASTPPSIDAGETSAESQVAEPVTPANDPDTVDDKLATATDDDADEKIFLGSGVFVQPAGVGRRNVYASADGVTLNFEQAALPEFLKVVFETILHENYLIDPHVKGSVTLHTTRPVTIDAVHAILEEVLQQNGAALIRDAGIFKVIPLADAAAAAGSPSIGRYSPGGSTGYTVQVVPLQHVSAAELQKIIEPFVPDGSSLRADVARNLLILSGPRYRIDELLATVRTFDVDWLKGMSFAMFKLQYADAATLVEELEAIIDGDGPTPLAGIVRVLPIERLNSVLVITHQPDHIAQIRAIIEQFDWGVEGSGGRRLYVYALENGKAENIATVLQEVFGQTQYDPFYDSASGSDSAANVFRSAESVSRPPPQPGSMDSLPDASGSAESPGGGVLAESSGDIKIIADQDNNAILVLSSQEDYRAIEAAIRKLDIAPRQVLIEATIAEVSLSNTLDYGVRWFLENSNGQIGFNAPVPATAAGEGLALAFFDTASDVKAFFDILATESSVKFLSTPQVMVLDNQTASIRVGDQIPVTTRSSQSTTNPDAPIVTEVQFRDTGTLLTVTPRINKGGQVTLEISQEVSLPGTEPAVGGGGNVSIAQRTINSSVIVQSGQTVVLGGLILETTSEGLTGVPGLMNIPLLGKLFSSTSEDVFRTELIITVRPRVVENSREMQQITEELRMRMIKASDYQDSVKSSGGST
jgi:general secretion pathway protein D